MWQSKFEKSEIVDLDAVDPAVLARQAELYRLSVGHESIYPYVHDDMDDWLETRTLNKQESPWVPQEECYLLSGKPLPKIKEKE